MENKKVIIALSVVAGVAADLALAMATYNGKQSELWGVSFAVWCIGTLFCFIGIRKKLIAGLDYLRSEANREEAAAGVIAVALLMGLILYGFLNPETRGEAHFWGAQCEDALDLPLKTYMIRYVINSVAACVVLTIAYMLVGVFAVPLVAAGVSHLLFMGNKGLANSADVATSHMMASALPFVILSQFCGMADYIALIGLGDFFA